MLGSSLVREVASVPVLRVETRAKGGQQLNRAEPAALERSKMVCQELKTGRTTNLSTASFRGCHAGSSSSGETVIGFAPTTVGRKAAPFCGQSARCR